MNQFELNVFIKEHSDDTDFIGGISHENIKKIEADLNVVFPQSYIWFLENFGSGGMFGVDILGASKSLIPSVVSNTKRIRELGLPQEYVVVENCEEFFYCLDTSHFSDDECPVISWDRVAGFSGERAKNFHEFLSTRLVEAKENWEEDI